MGIYLLLAAGLALLALVGGELGAAVGRRLRRAAALGAFEVRFDAAARPGGVVRVTGRAVPRRGRTLSVQATLVCTLFDHRAHRLFERTVPLPPTAGDGFAGELEVPEGALRSGRVGDDVSTLFSEEARRLLVSWTVEVEVLAPALVARRVLPLVMEAGAALAPEAAAVDRLVGGAFAEVREDLLFNWLVRAAARDGAIEPRERALLREVLRDAHGVSDPAEADRRIAEEQVRELDFDAALMRRHVPAATRVAFCRLLYAVAWRDGAMHREEKAYLAEKLDGLGLTRAEVRDVESEVLRDLAKCALG